jgi:hypothetical protein
LSQAHSRTHTHNTQTHTRTDVPGIKLIQPRPSFKENQLESSYYAQCQAWSLLPRPPCLPRTCLRVPKTPLVQRVPYVLSPEIWLQRRKRVPKTQELALLVPAVRQESPREGPGDQRGTSIRELLVQLLWRSVNYTWKNFIHSPPRLECCLNQSCLSSSTLFLLPSALNLPACALLLSPVLKRNWRHPYLYCSSNSIHSRNAA